MYKHLFPLEAKANIILLNTVDLPVLTIPANTFKVFLLNPITSLDNAGISLTFSSSMSTVSNISPISLPSCRCCKNDSGISDGASFISDLLVNLTNVSSLFCSKDIILSQSNFSNNSTLLLIIVPFLVCTSISLVKSNPSSTFFIR